MPSFATKADSIPVFVPTQETRQPRAFITRATASPGKTCPPVPAAAITKCFSGALTPDLLA